MSIRTRFERAFATALVLTAWGAAAQESDDPTLSAYRERFKTGLERYKAGDVAQAIQYWEPLYHDLGPERGYRVAYDLARAYETFGDATRAAERFTVFVDQTHARQARGDQVDELVQKEVLDATARLEELRKSRARIEVPPTTPPSSVAIDATEPRLAGFVAYVVPGAHTVVFDPGSDDMQKKEVNVSVGEVVQVTRDTPAAIAEAPPPPRPVVTRAESQHPFSAAWVFVAGGATALSLFLPYLTYSHAGDLRGRYSPPHPATPAEQDEYASARTLAYASWAAPIALGLVTTTIATLYFVKARTVWVPVVGESRAGFAVLGNF